MPMRICSFCGRDIQEGETHRLEEFLEGINTPEIKEEIGELVTTLAIMYKNDIECICADCFMMYKAQSVLPRQGTDSYGYRKGNV